MVDVLTLAQRQLNMRRIRSRDTKPEMIIRRGLHARGFRYRLHDRKLPGCPDMVFARYRAVFFVHGCFWHGHNCPMFKLPSTRQEFWYTKITANMFRDRNAQDILRKNGWRILVIWECALRGTSRWKLDNVLDACSEFLLNDIHQQVISGLKPFPVNEMLS